MATPEPNPYRQLNYPVNNLEQNFDQAKKIQVRANIGIPTSVDQTNKVLGVTAYTGELGWIPQSGGSRLYIPESWLTIISTANATVSSDHLNEVVAFLSAHSDILATMFFRSTDANRIDVKAEFDVEYRNTLSQTYTYERTPFYIRTNDLITSDPNVHPSGAGQNLVRSNINIESDTPEEVRVRWADTQYTALPSAVLLDALT